MRKVLLWIDTGIVGCDFRETVEVPNETTHEELNDMAQKYMEQHIEYGWQEEIKSS